MNNRTSVCLWRPLAVGSKLCRQHGGPRKDVVLLRWDRGYPHIFPCVCVVSSLKLSVVAVINCFYQAPCLCEWPASTRWCWRAKLMLMLTVRVYLLVNATYLIKQARVGDCLCVMLFSVLRYSSRQFSTTCGVQAGEKWRKEWVHCHLNKDFSCLNVDWSSMDTLTAACEWSSAAASL